MINDGFPRSKWSQRHVAYVCGHGTFGLNNMLISDRGCVGRYYSIITALPIETDPVVTEERCLYKRNGGCKLCVKRCVAEALTEKEFKGSNAWISATSMKKFTLPPAHVENV